MGRILVSCIQKVPGDYYGYFILRTESQSLACFYFIIHKANSGIVSQKHVVVYHTQNQQLMEI